MKKLTVRTKVTGHVQGVGFRAFTMHVALQNNVTGWVQNKPDGSVQAVLSGFEEDVRKVLGAIEKGPALSRVESVNVERTVFLSFDDFTIRR